MNFKCRFQCSLNLNCVSTAQKLVLYNTFSNCGALSQFCQPHFKGVFRIKFIALHFLNVGDHEAEPWLHPDVQESLREIGNHVSYIKELIKIFGISALISSCKEAFDQKFMQYAVSELMAFSGDFPIQVSMRSLYTIVDIIGRIDCKQHALKSG